jgi:chorismate dehydratase
MQHRIKILAISYANTLPFIYGIEANKFIKNYEIINAYPAKSVDFALDNTVDIALIPTAALPLFPQAEILSNYCIGATNKVDSVMLFSNQNIENIRTILLDEHSKTSVQLLKILVKKYWKLDNIQYKSYKANAIPSLDKETAILMIGDKVFKHQHSYLYHYDLAEIWNKCSGLHFIFALWVKLNPQISADFLSNFNKALAYGINHLDKVIEKYQKAYPTIDLKKYYTTSISYQMTKEKQKGMQTFLKLIR